MEANQYLEHLNEFIVQAKAATWEGETTEETSPRWAGAREHTFTQEAFTYINSYFGSQDFIGQEVVYYQGEPVWAMNYHGKILMPKKISNAQAAAVVQAGLSQMYQQGRFLGGIEHTLEGYQYYDTSIGGVSSFSGREWITLNNEVVYQLLYHGGLIE